MNVWRIAPVLLLLALCAAAQTTPAPKAAPQNSAPPTASPKPATITYDLNWPGAIPDHYTVRVEATGESSYSSDGPVVPDAVAGEPYLLKFTISDATRLRLFKLAEQLNFFQSDFDYKKSRIASTGAKTLTFDDGQRHYSTTYNWSQNPAIQQITELFAGISTTIESGRKLTYLYRHDKLGLDAELKDLVEMSDHKRLEELQVIVPTLQQLADDTSVMHIARRNAEKLVNRARYGPPSE